ncbi:MAG: hypothetical protein ACREPX_11250, partial [Rhodanobacteraceae bacterium]
MTFDYVLAWIAPLLFGSGVVASLSGRPRTPAEFAQVLGCGFVFGAIACGISIGLLGRVAVDRVVPTLAPLLIALGIG